MSELVPAPDRDERQRLALTDDARAQFLEALSKGWSVTKAAELVGVHRSTVHRARQADPEFAEAWHQAYEAGTDALRDEAWRRAVEGVDEPVYQGGALVGHVRRFSDRLLEVLWRQRDPKFRDRGADVQVAVDVGGGALPDRGRAALVEAAYAEFNERREEVLAEVRLRKEIAAKHRVHLPSTLADVFALAAELGIEDAVVGGMRRDGARGVDVVDGEVVEEVEAADERPSTNEGMSDE